MYWYQDELTEVAALVDQYGLIDVQAAAAAILAQDVDPLPGLVAAELQRSRKAARAAAIAEERKHRAAAEAARWKAKQDDPAAQARTRAQIDEIKQKFRLNPQVLEALAVAVPTTNT